jgi:hypothetical protein
MKTKKLYKNKKWLEEKYLKEKLSTYQIGKLCGILGQSITSWLIKYNIPRRTLYKNANHCNLSQEDIEGIRTELLNLGIKTTRQKRKNNDVIYILIQSIKDFLNYIGECPVRCYQYKFNC